MKAHIASARSAFTGGTGLEDHGQCALCDFLFFILYAFCFSGRVIVPSFGLGLESKQGRFNTTGEETEWEKYMK